MSPEATDSAVLVSSPMTARESWALWAAVLGAALFVLACVGIAFDVPGLREALDVRALFA